MLSLLFILSEYLPESGGGIVTFYRHLLPQLAAAGARVEVLVAREDQLDRPPITIDGVKVRYLASRSLETVRGGYERFTAGFPALSRFLPLAWAAYEGAHRGEGFDVVEVTDWRLLFLPWVAAGSAASVNVSLHGSCGQLDWNEPSPFNSAEADFVRLLEIQGIFAADNVQANSQRNGADWRRLSGRDIDVIPPPFHGIQASKCENPSGDSGLVVGRLQFWKGPHVLCEALRLTPELTVRWIGRDTPHLESGGMTSDWLKAKYPDVFGRQLVHEDQIPHEKVLRMMASARFVCAPSTWDVFNLTVVEAMAAGVPVVCSRAAGAEMLIQDRVNGFLVDSADFTSVAAGCRAAAGLSPEERRNMGCAAVQTIGTLLHPEKLCMQRLGAYRRMAARGPVERRTNPWLRRCVEPRKEINGPEEILKSFPATTLGIATGSQLIRGLRRRLTFPGESRSA